MRTILIDSAAVVSVLLVAALFVAAWLFLRLTSGARGLRARIERLFRLPERTRPLSAKHYYHAYWRAR